MIDRSIAIMIDRTALNVYWSRLRYFIRDNCTSKRTYCTSCNELLFSRSATSETKCDN
jgi:hypothetical protein